MTTRKTKNNRIRIGALVLAMLLSFSLFAGCGNSKNAGGAGKKPTTSQSASSSKGSSHKKNSSSSKDKKGSSSKSSTSSQSGTSSQKAESSASSGK